MRCIFCKNNSQNSKSVEHIVPESLENEHHVLPPGVVCDACNNYFATKVEKQFLESGSIKGLRFYEGVISKKGKIPPLNGILLPNFPIEFWRVPKDSSYINIVDASSEAIDYVMKGKTNQLILLVNGNEPDDFIVSRLLAKMAIEGLARSRL